MFYDLNEKEKAKWYDIRWKLSNVFVNIGKFIYPENPKIKAFLLKRILDEILYGELITKIDIEDIYKK